MSEQEKLEVHEHLIQIELMGAVEDYCESNKITQRELQRKLGFTEEHLDNLMFGNEYLTIQEMAIIQKSLGVKFVCELLTYNKNHIRAGINDVYARKKFLDKHMNELKGICKHENYALSYFSWRIGAMDVRYICSECDTVLSKMPTQKEIDKFIKDEKERNRKFTKKSNC